MSIFTRNDQKFEFHRYPTTENRSLRPWSAADELLLSFFDEHIAETADSETQPQVAVYHDRFGFLATVLQSYNPYVIYNYSSQEKSLRQNLQQNKLPMQDDRWFTPLSELPEKVDTVVMKIPKSMDLFKLYLHHAHQNTVNEEGVVVYCGFMTRHFTPQMLDIAGEYFETVEQTKAQKKARVIVLRNKKSIADDARDIGSLIQEIEWKQPVVGTEADSAQEPITLKQYYGVFSAGGVDAATELLISHMNLKEDDSTMLDLGCGNGIIAKAMQLQKPDAEIHALDDDFLAVASARINLGDEAVVHHYDGLDMFPSEFFDLIVTNPPSHLGHENNIEVALSLFEQASKKLKTGGRLIVVSTKHLNYTTHLTKRFINTRKLAETDKYEVLESTVA